MKGMWRMTVSLIMLIDVFVMMGACDRRQSAQYMELIRSRRKCVYRMKSTPVIFSSFIKDSTLYVLGDKEGLVRIDPKTGSEEILFGVGQGPNSMINPSVLSFQNGEALGTSDFVLNYVYHFEFQRDKNRIDRLKLPFSTGLDDAVALSNGRIACSSVYWDDGLVRIISKSGTLVGSFGKPHHIDLMMKFNVSGSAMYASGGKLYVIQGIVPEIQVLDISKQGEGGLIIPLHPPFYLPLPQKYDVPKYAFKKHNEWMARWTRLRDITGIGPWILVKYRKGYRWVFYYELLNLENLKRRYYFGPTDNNVCRIQVNDNRITVDGTCEKEEATEWVEDTYLLSR